MTPTGKTQHEASEGEIVISGLDTPAPAQEHTPTELHALWQGQLDAEHQYPEAEDEDG